MQQYLQSLQILTIINSNFGIFEFNKEKGGKSLNFEKN